MYCQCSWIRSNSIYTIICHTSVLHLIHLDNTDTYSLICYRRSVGRLKYYSYPEMCSLLAKSGVTNKSLGDMTYKLNTKGMMSALFNAGSPMNELHFMLLFEIARRLVRDSDRKLVSTDPALDLLPVGFVIGRVIELLRVEKDVVLSYEKAYWF